jgi:hypothetical protein
VNIEAIFKILAVAGSHAAALSKRICGILGDNETAI